MFPHSSWNPTQGKVEKMRVSINGLQVSPKSTKRLYVVHGSSLTF